MLLKKYVKFQAEPWINIENSTGTPKMEGLLIDMMVHLQKVLKEQGIEFEYEMSGSLGIYLSIYIFFFKLYFFIVKFKEI